MHKLLSCLCYMKKSPKNEQVLRVQWKGQRNLEPEVFLQGRKGITLCHHTGRT